jgi:hypothetical protein
VAAVLLSVHVIAAIVLIGPVTAAASLFPRYAREALRAEPTAAGARGVAHALHRISSGYALVAVAVPVFGIATAVQLGVLTDPWLLVSMALTAGAAALLGFVIVPAQREVLQLLALGVPAQGGTGRSGGTGSTGSTGREDRSPVAERLARLSGAAGAFSLTWAVVVVLMIVRPGSTTGV